MNDFLFIYFVFLLAFAAEVTFGPQTECEDFEDSSYGDWNTFIKSIKDQIIVYLQVLIDNCLYNTADNLNWGWRISN